MLPVRPRWADLTTDALHRSGYSAGQRFVNGRSGGGRPSTFGDLVVVDEIRGSEDEHLAHDVRSSVTLIVKHGHVAAQGAGVDKRIPGVGGTTPPTGDECAITGGIGAYQGAAGTLRLKSGCTATQ